MSHASCPSSAGRSRLQNMLPGPGIGSSMIAGPHLRAWQRFLAPALPCMAAGCSMWDMKLVKPVQAPASVLENRLRLATGYACCHAAAHTEGRWCRTSRPVPDHLCALCSHGGLCARHSSAERSGDSRKQPPAQPEPAAGVHPDVSCGQGRPSASSAQAGGTDALPRALGCAEHQLLCLPGEAQALLLGSCLWAELL